MKLGLLVVVITVVSLSVALENVVKDDVTSQLEELTQGLHQYKENTDKQLHQLQHDKEETNAQIYQLQHDKEKLTQGQQKMAVKMQQYKKNTDSQLRQLQRDKEELAQGLRNMAVKIQQDKNEMNAQLNTQDETIRHQSNIIQNVLAKYIQRKDQESRAMQCDLGSAPSEFLEMTNTYGAAEPFPLEADSNPLECMDMCRQMVDCYGVNIDHDGETIECLAVKTKPFLSNSSVWNYYEKHSLDACIVDLSEVAFQANLGASVCVPPNTTVVYPVIDVNYGGGFREDGCFLCPVHGLYKFNIRSRVSPGDRANLNMFLDILSLGHMDTYSHEVHTDAEYGTFFTECDIGQEVYVKTLGTEACLYDNGNKLTHFSGEMLFAL